MLFGQEEVVIIHTPKIQISYSFLLRDYPETIGEQEASKLARCAVEIIGSNLLSCYHGPEESVASMLVFVVTTRSRTRGKFAF